MFDHLSSAETSAQLKRTMKKCYEANADIYTFQLQINWTQISPSLPSLAMLLFNRLVSSLLPRFSRPPKMWYNNNSNHATKNAAPNRETDTHINISPLPRGSTVAVQCEDGGPSLKTTI